MKKNQNRKELMIMAMLTIIISAGVTTAFAHRGVSPELREDINQAVENGDYQAWLDLHPANSPMSDKITEDNFSQLQAMHQAMQSGDRETADAIREELGFPERGSRGMHKKMNLDHQAIQEAVENGDYQAWLDLHPANSPMSDKITEDNFSQLQAMHQAMQSGDRETADAIREELGFPERGEKRFDRGMHKNFNTNN